MRMLQLQKDIERENSGFFQQEKQRLSLIEKSAAAKSEELAIRADDKQKTLQEMTRKLDSGKRFVSPTRDVEDDA